MILVFFLILSIFIVIGLISLAIVSLIKGGFNRRENRLFAWFSVFIALWIVSNFVSNNLAISVNIALFANHLVFLSSYLSLFIFSKFMLELTHKNSKKTVSRSLVDLTLCFIGFLSLTPLIVRSIYPQNSVYAINFGPMLWIYAIGIMYMSIETLYSIFYGILKMKGDKRRQIIAVGIGLLISLPSVIIMSFVIPFFSGSFIITEFGIAPTIILVISIYYSVVNYRLFDIRLALIRVLTYLLSLFTLAVFYYLLAYTISGIIFNGSVYSSVSGSPISVILALILAFVFQPIRRFFDKITNKIFYKDYYNAEDFFARLNLDLSVTTDLRNLLEKVSKEIGQTLKSEQVFFYINTTDDRYISAGTTRHEQLPKDDISQLETLKKIVIASSLKTDSSIRRMMLSHRIEIAMPLYKGNNTIGCLCLGDNLSSGYTNRDIKVLSTISNELVIAIQNALAVQEIKELNSSLQQRIANATRELRTKNTSLRQLDKAKDEFVSMASHQLRTPLTSVKGYLSMVLEGDTGRITDPQRDLLNQAFASSERMVRLINDFLNVSRIQTGKFVIDKTPVMLPKLVSEEIDSLKPNAEARNLKFVYKPPKDFPAIKLDEGKIRQVVMNFADNAVYYSHENTAINIDLHIKDKKVFFAVKDSGIGVPKDEQEHLFTKFFRASNAKKQRPDGTGVGIYLAKRVIEAHGGEIIFESTEGQGSTFGFSLPIE